MKFNYKLKRKKRFYCGSFGLLGFSQIRNSWSEILFLQTVGANCPQERKRERKREREREKLP